LHRKKLNVLHGNTAKQQTPDRRKGRDVAAGELTRSLARKLGLAGVYATAVL